MRGKITLNPRGFGFVDFGLTAPAAFVAPPDLNPFLEGDVVDAAITTGADGRSTAKDLVLVERRRTELFGTVARHGGKTFLRVDRQVGNTDWPVLGADALAVGDAVVAAIKGAQASVSRVVPAGPDVALERVVARHGIRSIYSDELRAEAARVAKTPRLGDGRRDLRKMVTVTIDAEHTRDLDDALSALPAGPDGAIRVFVSIADVDAFVVEGSPLDLEARARGTSVYLAGRVIPMLPEVLCDDGISLLEGHDRPTLTVELRIDGEGAVTAVDLYPSIIRSTARLSYDAVAELISTGKSPAILPEVATTVKWLRAAAARLSAARLARGGVELLREEAEVHLDARTQEPLSIDARVDTAAHRLVERLMVAANEAVARFLVERGLPGVFRVHEAPEAARAVALERFASHFGIEAGFGSMLTPKSLGAFEQQLATSQAAPFLRALLARMLGPARYTVHAAPHFGLSAPLYLHFTSPIRRYADLAVHRIIKRYLAGDRAFVADDVAVEALAIRVNELARASAKAETDRLRSLAARLFASRIGAELSGYVTAVKPFGLVVQLEGIGVTGTVALDALPDGPYVVDTAAQAVTSAKRRYSIGDALEVRVAGANEELGRIDLDVVPLPWPVLRFGGPAPNRLCSELPIGPVVLSLADRAGRLDHRFGRGFSRFCSSIR